MPPRNTMPPLPLDLLTFGEVWKDFQAQNWMKESDPDKGESSFSLAVARVTRVDYSLHTVTLMMVSGTAHTELRAPVPISYPGAGPRHFFGAVPTVGSFCIVGFLPTKPSRTPVVLAWNIPNPWLGHDWVPTQDFQATEFDLNFRKQTELEGITHRVRHKLRHMLPGNICASSEQGADLVLDEGVLICDRRGDEFRIREQDGAFVFRSQQQFHASGGMRQYTGMVQRDASFLPAAMISDGRRWDGPKVTSNGLPSAPFQLDKDLLRQAGMVQPHDVFRRVQAGSAYPDSGYRITDPGLDPYVFLRQGLFIGEDGVVVDPDLTVSDAEYNGKTIFRVSADNPDSGDSQPANAALDADGETLVEHRIEIDHTWDGRLPVTEQTDGFDADRLPPSQGEGSALSGGERPFIEWVLGSVVGNDPFSQQGRPLYGKPLRATVFDDTGVIEPKLESAIGVNVSEHAATLFRLDPFVDNNYLPTFASFTKDGRFKAYISGPRTENSIEVATSGGIKVTAGGTLDLTTGSPLKIEAPSGDDEDNFGFCFTSPTGAICLTAGAATTRGSVTARTAPDAFEENVLPGIIVEAPTTSVDITAGRNVKISAGAQTRIENGQDVIISPQNSVSITTDKLAQQCTTIDRTVLAKETTLYSGPKNFNPANAPLRSVTFGANPLTGHFGGPTDTYKMVLGDRREDFLAGSHTTSVVVGNLSYQTGVGTFRAQAGTNFLALNTATGLTATVTVGAMTMTSTTTASITAVASASMVASTGSARVSGLTTLLGGAASPKTKFGAIIAESDIDPTSGLPFSTFGMGSSAHLLIPHVGV